MSTRAPKEWWTDHSSTRPGPARIRVTLSRSLTHAEREHLRGVGHLITQHLGDKYRVADDDRIYVESTTFTSRKLFEAISKLVEYAFVNVYPIAVRTFRELVEAPKPAKVDTRFPYIPPQVTVTTGNANVAYESRTQARPSTIAALREGLQQENRRVASENAQAALKVDPMDRWEGAMDRYEAAEAKAPKKKKKEKK